MAAAIRGFHRAAPPATQCSAAWPAALALALLVPRVVVGAAGIKALVLLVSLLVGAAGALALALNWTARASHHGPCMTCWGWSQGAARLVHDSPKALLP